MLTLIDCTKNATSVPVFVVYDTNNLCEYARIKKGATGWLVVFEGGGRQCVTDDVPGAFAHVMRDWAAECSTP